MDSLRIHWTAPADNPGPSAVVRYDVRMSGLPLTDANFGYAAQLSVPPPRPPGSPEALIVRGLMPGRTYWLAIRSVDASGNWSPLSNVVQWPPTYDSSPPAAPVNLSESRDPDGGFIELNWDPSSSGDLAGYNLYRSVDASDQWVKLFGSPRSGTYFIDDQVPSGASRLSYAVTASDWAGNESARSAPVVVVIRDSHAAGAAEWRLMSAYPNPAPVGGVVHIPLNSPANGGTGRLEIFDSANLLVRRFEVPGGSLGGARLDWDGRNDRGALCAPGIYRVRLTAGSVHQSVRIARTP